MKKLLLIIPVFFLLYSCKKENDINTRGSDGLVFIRVHNAAPFVLESAGISDVSYGNIIPGVTTSYKVIASSVYGGYCRFTRDGNETFAGYGMCGTPLPPEFEPGHYTFTVEAPADGFCAVTVTRE